MRGGVNSLNSPKLKPILAFAVIFSFFSTTLQAQTDTKTLKLFAPPSGAVADSVLLWRSDSTVRKINSSQISIEPWLAATTTNKATNNTQSIYQNGRVGIGNFNTTTPATALDIENGTTNGAIKIVDGTQGAGKVLVSDANGIGTWNQILTAPDTSKLIKGTWLINAGDSVDASSNTKYAAWASLTLQPGTYYIYYRLHFLTSNPPPLYVSQGGVIDSATLKTQMSINLAVHYTRTYVSTISAANSSLAPILFGSYTFTFFINGADVEPNGMFMFTCTVPTTIYLLGEADGETKATRSALANENYFYAQNLTN